MRKYALINKNLVTSIIESNDLDFSEYSKNNELIIDITDLNPLPQINWVLNGNKLEFPSGFSDREKLEIELASKKTDFGIKLARYAIDRIGARNKILNKTGEQVSILLTQLVGVKLLLETGALSTARFSCIQLKFIYTEYTDIFDYVINEINSFEASVGL